jgi:hypothetical protein
MFCRILSCPPVQGFTLFSSPNSCSNLFGARFTKTLRIGQFSPFLTKTGPARLAKLTSFFLKKTNLVTVKNRFYLIFSKKPNLVTLKNVFSVYLCFSYN